MGARQYRAHVDIYGKLKHIPLLTQRDPFRPAAKPNGRMVFEQELVNSFLDLVNVSGAGAAVDTDHFLFCGTNLAISLFPNVAPPAATAALLSEVAALRAALASMSMFSPRTMPAKSGKRCPRHRPTRRG